MDSPLNYELTLIEGWAILLKDVEQPQTGPGQRDRIGVKMKGGRS